MAAGACNSVNFATANTSSDIGLGQPRPVAGCGRGRPRRPAARGGIASKVYSTLKFCMDVTLDVIFACKFFSDVILHVISDMHGERARCARRKFDMNFTYMTPITSRFCMDVTPDVKSPTISVWM